MSGHNYSYNESGRPADRSDNYDSRRFEPSLRNFRGRGSFRSRGSDHYRGRGGYRGRDPRDYRDHHRDYRERDPRDPRDRAPRDRDPRDREPRDREREEYNRSSRDYRDRDEHVRPDDRRDRRERPEKFERAERIERGPERPLERGSERGAERLPERGPERGSRPFRGGFRGDGIPHREDTRKASGSNTPSGDHGNKHAAKPESKYADPWISILKLGEGKTAARVDANYRELASVNKSISLLQEETFKLQCLLSMLEVYGSRDALSVEVSKEKLDEFTYI